MKYLVIDRTKVMPIRLVVEAGGRAFGNTRLLDDAEVPAYAKWLGLVGGRELLDAFEVMLINDGMLRVWPVDADGVPLHDECQCIAALAETGDARIAMDCARAARRVGVWLASFGASSATRGRAE